MSDATFLTTQEARARMERALGRCISKGTFEKWIARRNIISIRLVGKVLIPAFAVDEAIDTCFRGESFVKTC